MHASRSGEAGHARPGEVVKRHFGAGVVQECESRSAIAGLQSHGFSFRRARILVGGWRNRRLRMMDLEGLSAAVPESAAGIDRRVGTVTEIYGPSDRRWAEVDLIVTGSSGEPLSTTSTAVPADRLDRVELRRDASWRACAGSILIESQPIPVVLHDTTWSKAGLGDHVPCDSAIAHRAAAFAVIDRSDLDPKKLPRSRDGLMHVVVLQRHVRQAMEESPYAESHGDSY